MATVAAIRYADLPDADLARILAGRYQDLRESEPENVQTRIGYIKTPLDEAVRRLKTRNRP